MSVPQIDIWDSIYLYIKYILRYVEEGYRAVRGRKCHAKSAGSKPSKRSGSAEEDGKLGKSGMSGVAGETRITELYDVLPATAATAASSASGEATAMPSPMGRTVRARA